MSDLAKQIARQIADTGYTDNGEGGHFIVESKVEAIIKAALAEREAQAVQREREAARELIKELREAIEDCLENTAERAALGYDAETTIDEEDGTVCYPWGNSHNVRLQAAIQKAKEAKV